MLGGCVILSLVTGQKFKFHLDIHLAVSLCLGSRQNQLNTLKVQWFSVNPLSFLHYRETSKPLFLPNLLVKIFHLWIILSRNLLKKETALIICTADKLDLIYQLSCVIGWNINWTHKAHCSVAVGVSAKQCGTSVTQHYRSLIFKSHLFSRVTTMQFLYSSSRKLYSSAHWVGEGYLFIIHFELH